MKWELQVSRLQKSYSGVAVVQGEASPRGEAEEDSGRAQMNECATPVRTARASAIATVHVHAFTYSAVHNSRTPLRGRSGVGLRVWCSGICPDNS